MPTEKLVTDAINGDDRALDSLLVECLPALQAYVRLNAGSAVRAREETADLVQSVCREVLRNADGFDYRGESAFRGWLFTHALRKIVDKARHFGAARRDAAREVPRAAMSDELAAAYATLVTPSRDAIGREAITRLETAFDALSPAHREAVSLRRLAGLDYAEIATTMERSEGAVRNLVYRGLAQLAAELDRTE